MFHFKQFSVKQDRSAMKVGTDGVLLGAWTPLIGNPYNILDIGAGTGLVSLMLAQRSNAEQIDAVELDENAYEECVENFENAQWNDRLFCYHASFEEFTDEIDERYDLIVSNPPFYTENVFTPSAERNLARFADALPFPELLKGTAQLLSENGIFAVIIPYSHEPEFTALAQKNGLFPFKITRVKGTPETEIKRSLIAFLTTPQHIETSELIIETARHFYTEDYKQLTQDFFLKF